MKLFKPTPPIDQQLMERYRDVCLAHPGCLLAPLAVKDAIHGNIDRAIRGELTHTIVQFGPLLLVRWVPSPQVQWIFDLYAQ